MSDPRKVPAELAWRVAKQQLGRLACMYNDPLGSGHNHADCVRDDESFIADRLLLLLNAVCRGDDDASLDSLTELQAIIHRAT